MFFLFILGELDLIDQFTYGETTGSYLSCSAVIHGLMMIFGGHTLGSGKSFIKQISIVESCQLRRLGDLPMEFKFGACNTYKNGDRTEKTLLCFGYAGQNMCHR